MSDPRRFIGRKAAACRKCNGSAFYVNRMGGLICLECSPPRVEADNCQELAIEGGIWIDPDDRFDMVDVVEPGGAGGSARAAMAVPAVTSTSETRTELPTESPKEALKHPLNLPLRSSRGPNGELSEAELQLFSSPAVWGTPANRDLITTYGNVVVWVSEMFEASDEADRQEAITPRPMTQKLSKEGGRSGALLPM